MAIIIPGPESTNIIFTLAKQAGCSNCHWLYSWGFYIRPQITWQQVKHPLHFSAVFEAQRCPPEWPRWHKQKIIPGTPCYMPLEALMAKPKYTSKIYSYGVILIIHILCGRWPFPGEAYFHPFRVYQPVHVQATRSAVATWEGNSKCTEKKRDWNS